MAKKTFTEFVAGDNDQNSPYEEAFVASFENNNHAMKKTPFYLRWHDANNGDADNSRAEWRTNATSGTFATRTGWWPLWVLPGMDVLHIRMLAAVTAAANTGAVRMDFSISAPNQTPDVTDEETESGITSIFPTMTEISFTFSEALGDSLHDRWGRMARLRLRGTMTTRSHESQRLVVAEHPDAVCYWGQAI